jgi:hypothetical protein
MKEICIHLPTLGSDETIELEVKLNGRTRIMNYRVETFDWTADTTHVGGKISKLRHFIRNYDDNWELVQIGSPSDERISVMFRQRK